MIARLRARPLLRQPGRCTFRQRVGYLHGSIAHRHTGAHNWTTCIWRHIHLAKISTTRNRQEFGEPAFRSHSATAAGPQPSREIRNGRVTLRLVCRRSPHRTGPFARSGQAEIRTQLLCSSAASYEAARSGDRRDCVPRPPRRAAHRRPGPGQRQGHSPRRAPPFPWRASTRPASAVARAAPAGLTRASSGPGYRPARRVTSALRSWGDTDETHL